MFDFKKLKMKPSHATGFEPPATNIKIAELEKHCRHTLPENYKIILKNYHGGMPEAKYFHVIDEETGLLGEMELYNFYLLNNDKSSSTNIWWLIQTYSKYIGNHALPFADDGLQQFYYMKWVNEIPQVWFLAYLDLAEPETFPVADSFDKLLDSLYAAD